MKQQLKQFKSDVNKLVDERLFKGANSKIHKKLKSSLYKLATEIFRSWSQNGTDAIKEKFAELLKAVPLPETMSDYEFILELCYANYAVMYLQSMGNVEKSETTE